MNANATIVTCGGYQQNPPLHGLPDDLGEMRFRLGGGRFLAGADVDYRDAALQSETDGARKV